MVRSVKYNVYIIQKMIEWIESDQVMVKQSKIQKKKHWIKNQIKKIYVMKKNMKPGNYLN